MWLWLLALPAADSTYLQTRQAILAERQDLQNQYLRAPAPTRAAILAEARQVLLHALTRRLPELWQGTPWAFNGLSDTPQMGAIACGTYVGTLFQHAGFNLNRVALGRLASEHIGLSLGLRQNLRRYSNRSAQDVAADVIAWGPGLYLVGLDNHAGLVWVTEAGEARFLHSSVWATGKVVDEPLLGDNPFMFSRYRVLVKLLDDNLVRAWLLGERIEARAGGQRRAS